MSSPWGEALDSAAAESDEAFGNVLSGFFETVADAARRELEGE